MPTNLFIPFGMIYALMISMLFSAFSTKAQSPLLVKKESKTTYKNAYLTTGYSAQKQLYQAFQSPNGLMLAIYVEGITQVDGKQCKVFMIHPTTAVNLHWI